MWKGRRDGKRGMAGVPGTMDRRGSVPTRWMCLVGRSGSAFFFLVPREIDESGSENS